MAAGIGGQAAKHARWTPCGYHLFRPRDEGVGGRHRERDAQAPGAVFRPHLERSAWIRFNVTACEDTRVLNWLQRLPATTAA